MLNKIKGLYRKAVDLFYLTLVQINNKKFELEDKTTYNPERGQSVVEYALLVVLIAVFALGAMAALGVSITGIFKRITSVLDSGTSDSGSGK